MREWKRLQTPRPFPSGSCTPAPAFHRCWGKKPAGCWETSSCSCGRALELKQGCEGVSLEWPVLNMLGTICLWTNRSCQIRQCEPFYAVFYQCQRLALCPTVVFTVVLLVSLTEWNGVTWPLAIALPVCVVVGEVLKHLQWEKTWTRKSGAPILAPALSLPLGRSPQLSGFGFSAL